MKKLLLFVSILIALKAQAQKDTFDIISYTAPKGWKKETTNTAVSYSFINNSKRTWCQLAIYKSTASKGNIDADFESEWDGLVAKNENIMAGPEKNEVEEADGWKIVSGGGKALFNNADMMILMTTFSGYNTCISVVAKTNSAVYLKDIENFNGTIELQKPESNINEPTSQDKSNSVIVGLWGFYDSETYGNNLTGGYFRKEYLFYEDGTYLYRKKDWSTTVKEILFVNETGTYTVSGNQLTLSPHQGNGEWWSKPASQRTDEWGNRLKAAVHKLETTTYTFELEYLSGMGKTYLTLKCGNATERDGKKSKQNNSINEFRYQQVELNKSKINNPPQTKIN